MSFPFLLKTRFFALVMFYTSGSNFLCNVLDHFRVFLCRIVIRRLLSPYKERDRKIIHNWYEINNNRIMSHWNEIYSSSRVLRQIELQVANLWLNWLNKQYRSPERSFNKIKHFYGFLSLGFDFTFSTHSLYTACQFHCETTSTSSILAIPNNRSIFDRFFVLLYFRRFIYYILLSLFCRREVKYA